MSRAPLSYMTAYLQFTVAIMFMVGYFGLLAILFLGNASIPTELLELAKTLAVGLSGALGLLFAFLYLRSRVDGPPDPATTTTTQTTETVTTPTPPTGDIHAPTTTTPVLQPPVPAGPDSLREPRSP